MRTDPQVVEKFVRATSKGLFYSRANRSGTIAILVRHLKVDEKTAAKIYDIGKAAMTVDGSVSELAQKRALEFVARVQGFKDPGPADKFFDFSLTRSVSEQLQAQSWKP
jgi:ABC-type nitrate/sulfonate/bicarbonate transport system substrate-binding protein